MLPPRATRLEVAALVAVLTVGVGLRARDLGCTPFWVDEAESTINALTILQHGYPVDRYLGLPLYENTLVQPWPEHPEYEFSDLSYSTRGVAVYHGWLPLYAIAGSLALAGIEPDEETTTLSVRHSTAEMRRLTVAARLPAVVFGVLFLSLLYWAGTVMGGRETGWSALLLGAFSQHYISLATHARYYSATLAVAVASGLAIWLMATRGRWRHFLLGGLLLVVLFHTHLMSFVAACGFCAVVVPFAAQGRRTARRLALTATVVIVGIAPWMILTRFVEQSARIPMAWSLEPFPSVLADIIFKAHTLSVPIFLGLIWFLFGGRSRKGLIARLKEAPGLALGRMILFLAAWLIIGFLAATALVPAASYFHHVYTLILVPPGILMAAAIIGAASRSLSPRYVLPLSATMVAGLLIVSGNLPSLRARECGWVPENYATIETVEQLRARSFEPDTKLYAFPSHQLILSVYTGLPIQSIAPVRKSFIDSYPGRLVMVEVGERFRFASDDVQDEAMKMGRTISATEAQADYRAINARLTVEDLAGHVDYVATASEPMQDFYEAALPRLRDLSAERVRKAVAQPQRRARSQRRA